MTEGEWLRAGLQGPVREGKFVKEQKKETRKENKLSFPEARGRVVISKYDGTC